MIDLRKILFLPEGKTLEFKRDLSSMKSILKTLVAFANTAGGTLIIGREDDGSIVGVDDVFDSEERLTNVIADSIYPFLMAEIETTSVEGKPLLVVRVAHWSGPFYIKTKGPDKGVYVRLGSTNRVAGSELLAELKRSIFKVSFDQLPCPEIDVTGLDKNRIDEAFANVGRKVDQNKLETLGVLVPYSGKLVCSNGGLILFGHDHLRNQYFSNALVRCARFRGTEKIDFIDQYDVEGTIIEAMKEVPKFVRRNTRLAAKIERIQREDIPEYSTVAVREVLTNAFVHADYSIKGMNPRVVIFSDRLEIESPGMLPFGYTLDDLVAGISHIRNKVIARVFRELYMMEEWGTGYKRITEACREGGYSIPVWEEVGTAIRVIFCPHPATREKPEIFVSPELKKLSHRQQEVLALFRQEEKLTAIEIYNRLGQGISERTLRLDLLELKNRGLLKMIGSGPSTYWMLK